MGSMPPVAPPSNATFSDIKKFDLCFRTTELDGVCLLGSNATVRSPIQPSILHLTSHLINLYIYLYIYIYQSIYAKDATRNPSPRLMLDEDDGNPSERAGWMQIN